MPQDLTTPQDLKLLELWGLEALFGGEASGMPAFQSNRQQVSSQ
jgi:hypothetical protein